MGGNDWDIEFAKRQRAAHEKAKAELRWLVEQEQLRDGKVTPVIQAEATPAEVNNKPQGQGGQHRYASDAPLIERGRQMVASGMSKRQAATKLAAQAEGGSLEQKAERLRKLL